MSDQRPPWLRAMENGTIGEARTRSLLLDRFWVLERSVDVEGADFIIMRRLTQRSLLDPVPPRVGFVQVKYYDSPGTTAHVHAEYVLDRAGKPRTEFFVVAHTGREGDARMFFLDAEKIATAMQLKEDDKGQRFVLRGSDVLTDAFRAPSPNVVLDVIERALERADWGHNRDFLSWALPSAREEMPLPERFSAPLPIEGADLLSSFRDLKEKAQRSLYDIDEVREPLVKIAGSSDPIEAFGLAEVLKIQHTGGRDTYVSFDPGYDEDAQRHWFAYEELHDVLEEHRLLLPVAEMRRRFEEAVVQGLLGTADERDLRISMLYVVDTLAVRDVSVAFVDPEPASNAERFRPYFMVVRVASDHVCLIWHKPSSRHCSHSERGKPDERRNLVTCREHIAPYAEDGFALLLHDVVQQRFPDEKFRFYR